jgi:IPT/TIG domain
MNSRNGGASALFLATLLVACLAGVVSFAQTGPVPAIQDISPASGPAGTTVTITGSGFGAMQGSSSVTLSGTIVTPISWSNTKIVVPVPQQAPTGPIVVKVGSVSSNGALFKVTP